MTRPVYVSSTSFESRDLAAILGLCEEGKLDGLELSVLDGWDETLLWTKPYPSRFLVHNYFPPPDRPFILNLASRDEATLARSRAHCRSAIDLSRRLGGAVYAAHGGYTTDLSPEMLGRPELQAELRRDELAPRHDAYVTLVESVRELCVYGRERGVRFLIENHVLPRSAGERGAEVLLMVDADELEQLVDDVGDPSFGLLVDVGHLRVSAETAGFDPNVFLDRVAPWIGAFHLSDNDGTVDAHEAFGDEAWFLPRLVDMPEASITLEVAPAPLELITDMRDTVARWL
jgi:sugar phosphate isomerase/epimerase